MTYPNSKIEKYQALYRECFIAVINYERSRYDELVIEMDKVWNLLTRNEQHWVVHVYGKQLYEDRIKNRDSNVSVI